MSGRQGGCLTNGEGRTDVWRYFGLFQNKLISETVWLMFELCCVDWAITGDQAFSGIHLWGLQFSLLMLLPSCAILFTGRFLSMAVEKLPTPDAASIETEFAEFQSSSQSSHAHTSAQSVCSLDFVLRVLLSQMQLSHVREIDFHTSLH